MVAPQSRDPVLPVVKKTLDKRRPGPAGATGAHQNMASKIFCCCCQASEGPATPVGSHSQRTSQQHHPRTFNMNADPHRNCRQKRHPHLHPHNLVLKKCALGRP